MILFNTYIMKKILGIIVLVIIALGVYQFIQNTEKDTASLVGQNEVIRIGAPLSLSGPAVNDGEAIKKGIEIAVADYKQQGVNIMVDYIDDKTEIKDTLSAVNLLTSKKVDALIGPTWSFLYSAATPVIDREEVITFGPAVTSEYSSEGEYSFQLPPLISDSNKELVNFLEQYDIKNVVFLATQYEWSESHLNNLKQAVSLTNGEVIVEWMQFGGEVESLPTLLAQIKKEDPDLIFFEAGSDEIYSTLFNRLDQLEIETPIITATPNIGRFMNNNPELRPDNDIFILAPGQGENFSEHFKKQVGTYPTEYSEYGYDAVKIIVQAIQENGRENLKEYIEDNTFQGFTKTYSFNENHDAANGEWIIRKDN